ncbi:MAG: prepilin-type N-terminal cleavage/methylation domain-containing protein [Patulibacter sp.]|nr:prepilin-type N-terminal cleavage/methylation domain-containing protein [Patulibacter sp.]
MPPPRTPTIRSAGPEDGFTLVEVMVAMLLLLIGLFGVLNMLDQGNESTARTLTRDAAVGLARDVVERAATTDPIELTPATIGEVLRTGVDPDGARGTTPTGSDGSWTLRGRTTFRVRATVCSLARPGDGVPVVDASFCTAGTTPTGPVVTSGGCSARLEDDPAIGVQVRLLVAADLCVGGSLAGTVCALLGPVGSTNTMLAPLLAKDGAVNAVLHVAGGSAGIDVCGERPVIVDPGTRASADAMRRVRVRVSWGDASAPYVIEQTTLVPSAGATT